MRFGLREAVEWLKSAPTSPDSGDFRGWIFPMPARMSVLFILQYYILETPKTRQELHEISLEASQSKSQSQSSPQSSGRLFSDFEACIASDMKFVRQLSQGKIKYDSSGDKRIAVLRGAQTIAAWLRIGMELKHVRFDIVLDCMASGARLCAGWMATNDSILPEAADEVPEVHLCFCCWASLQVHDLMEDILTRSMRFLELAVEEVNLHLDEVIYARKDELRGICRVIKGAERELDAYLAELNKGPTRKKTRFWEDIPDRIEAVMAVSDEKAAAREEQAQAVADAAMLALLAEVEGSQQAQHEAEEKKKAKRQKQKEKLRAAKEAAAAEEKGRKEAVEALKKEIEDAKKAKEAAVAEERAKKLAEEAAKRAAEEERLALERAAKKKVELERKKAEAKERKAKAEAARLAEEAERAALEAALAAKREAAELVARQQAEAERLAREGAAAEARRQEEERAQAAAALEAEQAQQAQQAAERAVEYLGFDTKSDNEDRLMDSIRYLPGFETIATPPLTEASAKFIPQDYYSAPVPTQPQPAVHAEPSGSRQMGATQDDLKQLLSLLLPGMEAPPGDNTSSAVEESPPSSMGSMERAEPAGLRPAALPPHTALAVCIAQPHRWAALESALRCPASGEPLFDPMIMSDGRTYDRETAKRAGFEVQGNGRPNLAVRQLMQYLFGQ